MLDAEPEKSAGRWLIALLAAVSITAGVQTNLKTRRLDDGFFVGVPLASLLLTGYFLARRWRLKRLVAENESLVDETATDFAPELAAWPEPVDLHRPASVGRLLGGLEAAGITTRPWRGFGWPFRHWFAPF